mmetsp:Transcript_9218/g.26571  ORF Transcript_9218/g.26571 Transcript_9218/m.26571 type:complete len:307 (+) Transcript_9218:256-1176(+)
MNRRTDRRVCWLREESRSHRQTRVLCVSMCVKSTLARSAAGFRGGQSVHPSIHPSLRIYVPPPATDGKNQCTHTHTPHTAHTAVHCIHTSGRLDCSNSILLLLCLWLLVLVLVLAAAGRVLLLLLLVGVVVVVVLVLRLHCGLAELLSRHGGLCVAQDLRQHRQSPGAGVHVLATLSVDGAGGVEAVAVIAPAAAMADEAVGVDRCGACLRVALLNDFVGRHEGVVRRPPSAAALLSLLLRLDFRLWLGFGLGRLARLLGPPDDGTRLGVLADLYVHCALAVKTSTHTHTNTAPTTSHRYALCDFG